MNGSIYSYRSYNSVIKYDYTYNTYHTCNTYKYNLKIPALIVKLGQHTYSTS